MARQAPHACERTQQARRRLTGVGLEMGRGRQRRGRLDRDPFNYYFYMIIYLFTTLIKQFKYFYV
jgi:hypothetical protein